MSTVILGGGISGLLAAYVFKGKETILIERSPTVGGDYLAGGLKYLRRTTNLEDLFKRLRLDWQAYLPAGAVLWDGALHPHPEWMRTKMSAPRRREIQTIHWKRTRGSLDGFQDTCMNDPMGAQEEAMRVDHAELLKRLEATVRDFGVKVLTEVSVNEVAKDYVDTSMGSFPFDQLVTTINLLAARRLFKYVRIPDLRFRQLTIARALSLPTFLLERGGIEYDYIYTPNMEVFHRISRTRDNKWEMEATGIWAEPEAHKHFDGLKFDKVSVIPGHLIPAERIDWPHNILPVGRFAEWNTRSTADKSLDRLMMWRALRR